MVTAGIFPFKENSHVRAGNRTRNLVISSQRLSPLDHEAGRFTSTYSLPTLTSVTIKQWSCTSIPQTAHFRTKTYSSVIWCKLHDSMLTAWERHNFMHTRSVSYMRVLSGDRIPVTSRFSTPIQTGPGALPASNTGSIPVVQRPKRGVNHPSTPI